MHYPLCPDIDSIETPLDAILQQISQARQRERAFVGTLDELKARDTIRHLIYEANKLLANRAPRH